MKWFKKSLPENRESLLNQKHQRIKKTASNSNPLRKSSSLPAQTTAAESNEKCDNEKMQKSLSALACHSIEVIDPEVFFHDPEHVRNYKEEEVFLQIMSEWEIIENPANMSNYFSADFEDEFVQMRTQTTDAAASSAQSASSGQISEATSDNAEPKRAPRKRSFKRSLTEIFFADKIEVGLLPPMDSAPSSDCSSPTLNKKRRRLRVSSKADDSATSSNHIIKDCAIDRSQLKTEALARSIMGAIGRCPARDKTPRSSINDLIQQTGDFCHPINSCDHYDIKQFFRLDDNGNILLNMNHIEEIRGIGMAARENQRLYKRYLKEGCTAEEDGFCNRKCCIEILKRILKLLWEKIKCNPRNEIYLYSNGPGEAVRSYTLQLASDPNTTFARNIENFICSTKDSSEAAPQVVMCNMRQFMNGMKNYLVKHGEGHFQHQVETVESRLNYDEFLNLDALLETVMHELVVLPLREHLYAMFVDYYTRSTDIQLLAQNIKYASERPAKDFGISSSVVPPSPASLQVISNLLLRLQEAELPLEKMELFLCVISTIFDASGCPKGEQLGADDFLPILVYVVAKCGFIAAEIEAEFMWGLLQPTLLCGEPGYYLTALCSAVHVLKNFKASHKETETNSLDWLPSSLMACSSVLRVVIPDDCNGSLQTRTLAVRPRTTTQEVCRIIAHKARIVNPCDYGLFKLIDGEETLLNDTDCPHDLRLAAKGKHYTLAYKRVDVN